MKFKFGKIIILFFGLISVSLNAKTILSDTCKGLHIDKEALSYQNVIVCSGQYAYAYHSRSNCPGLNNCQGQLYTVSEYDAVAKYGRKACCRCWQNVDNCHDDNPSNTGGSSSAINLGIPTLLILAAVATGTILLSNEIYVAPSYSFRKPIGITQNIENISSLGWMFHFRKNFAHSGLEYGAGATTYRYRVVGNSQNYNLEQQVLGRFNLNYVHNVFYNKLPPKISVFIGPSINYVTAQNAGIGFIIGSSYKLSDRWKADIRYELTTTTHLACIGLQFLYQKKYLWEK